MKKKLVFILTLTLITRTTPFEPPMHRSKPKAAKCIWKQNRKYKEFTDPTKQIAGYLIFYDEQGNTLITVDYNPITDEIRYIKQPKNIQGHNISVRKAFHRNTFKAIGTELGLDVTNMDETECNESIAAWLPQSEPWCIVQ